MEWQAIQDSSATETKSQPHAFVYIPSMRFDCEEVGKVTMLGGL